MLGRTAKKSEKPLMNELVWAIHDYKTTINPLMRWEYAKECYRLIEWARSWNILEDKDIVGKLKVIEEENIQLKKTKEALEGRIKELETKVSDQNKLLELRGIHEFSIPKDNEEDELGKL
jgi:hypothetical protein